jgi:Rieske Fe-S protein
MKPAAHAAAAQRAAQTPHLPEPRRSFLAEVLAVVIGGIVAVFPFASGLIVFLDPILRRRSAEGGEVPFRRVASLGALPVDGTPVQAPVIADLEDAWNREVNQPVGAVYLIRKGNEVIAYNAICPHAGCFVGYAADRKCFQCPCHTSSFQLDGTRIGANSPAPRDMDPLEVKVEGDNVLVQFKNFYPGKEEREVKQ